MPSKQNATRVLDVLSYEQLQALHQLSKWVPPDRRGSFLRRTLSAIHQVVQKYPHTCAGTAIGAVIGYALDTVIRIPFTNIHPTGWSLTLLFGAIGAYKGYSLDMQKQKTAHDLAECIRHIIVEELQLGKNSRNGKAED